MSFSFIFSFNKNSRIRFIETLAYFNLDNINLSSELSKLVNYKSTSIKLFITQGKTDNGNLKILKRLMHTNAVLASNLLFSSINKYVANDTIVTFLIKIL
jgi:hypothetical protein